MKHRLLVVACTIFCTLACTIQIQPAASTDQMPVLTVTEPPVAGTGTASRGTRRKKLDKLKMATFTKYQARLLLPVQYEKKDKDNQLTAMGADIPHGMYMFMSMSAPDKVHLDAAAIKPIIKGTIEAMKADCAEETMLKLGEYEGLQCRGKVRVDADVEAIVRGYVAERRMYFVSVVGTSPWIKSDAVTRYLNSFEITQ